MDTPTNFIQHERPLVGVEECFDWLGHFSHPSFLFHLVDVVCICVGD